jgi:hypothetical protein
MELFALLILIGLVFLSPVGILVSVILIAMAVSAWYRRRMLPPMRGEGLRVDVGADGEWRCEGRPVILGDRYRLWPKRIRVPRSTCLEVFGVARDSWLVDGYRDTEHRILIAASPGRTTVDVFIGSRAAFERELAGDAIGWKTVLLFGVSLAALLFGVWVCSLRHGFG